MKSVKEMDVSLVDVILSETKDLQFRSRRHYLNACPILRNAQYGYHDTRPEAQGA
jgi:hypothetical protein